MVGVVGVGDGVRVDGVVLISSREGKNIILVGGGRGRRKSYSSCIKYRYTYNI